MKILVTGASGFVARHLIPSLLKNNPKATILGISRHRPEFMQSLPRQCSFKTVDLLNVDALRKIVGDFKPTHIYHLAGMSFVGGSFDNPGEVFRANVEASINLLNAVLQAGLQSKVLLVSSGQVYGKTFSKKIAPSEKDIALPMSPYALSKLMMEEAGMYCFNNYRLPVYIVRSFNHFGPGQSPKFSIASFAQQFACMKKGQKNKLFAGDIGVLRDFTDVRDIAEGYQNILKKGEPGEIYNLGSGRAITLRKLIQDLEKLSGLNIKIVSNVSRRSLDLQRMQANIKKAKRFLGWKPRHSFEETLEELYNFYRK